MSDLLPDHTAVEAHVAAFERELAAAKSVRDAQSVRDRYLGRKNSVVASWMQLIGSAPSDQKKNIGRYANELKQAIEARWNAYAETARDAAPAGAVDVTLPGRVPLLGHRHPLTIVRDQLEEIFTRMGFTVVEGAEAEDDWHCMVPFYTEGTGQIVFCVHAGMGNVNTFRSFDQSNKDAIIDPAAW